MERESEQIADVMRSGNGDQHSAGGLHSRQVFFSLLKRERERSDRFGSEFSLSIFDVTGFKDDFRVIEQVARHVLKQIRSIDDAGWLEGSRIGVILPATNQEGGCAFGRRVLDSISPAVDVPVTVCSYPTKADEGVQVLSGGYVAQLQSRVSDHYVRKTPVWKRSMDIVLSLVALAFLTPLFLVMILYIKCVSPGRAFFTQKRVGRQGRLFTLLKFRTMKPSTDESSHRDYVKELIRASTPMEKLDCSGDQRIIPGGRIIRKAAIDELPQLINVLKGDMSLVGPRPCIPYEAAEYLRWHARRFDILPGMTGLWQVSGKNKLSFEKMIRLDIAYSERLSLVLDLTILFRTVPTVIGLIFEAMARKSGRAEWARVSQWSPESAHTVGSGMKGSAHSA